MIILDRVSKSYASRGVRTTAIGSISFSVQQGEFVSIVGPSGCGKSTLLNLLAGFMPASGGHVLVNRKEVTSELPANLGYIFQKDTVMPWLSVFDNVALGLRYKKTPEKEMKRRVEALLELGKLAKFSQAYPHQLSGGMRRRLALLMSLACDPKTLLLDEPFGALDTHTRTNLHKELLRIWALEGQTVVLVTHDLDEAITLSNRVIVLSGPPSEVLLDEKIEIEYPRDVYSIRKTAQFAKHYANVWSVLGEQFRHVAAD